jgi:hypothetical protein
LSKKVAEILIILYLCENFAEQTVNARRYNSKITKQVAAFYRQPAESLEGCPYKEGLKQIV